MLTQAFPSDPTSPVPLPLRPASGEAKPAIDDAIDLKMGQLLCSRLCHDLIGPAAAINAGGELMGDDDDDDVGDVRDLIVESARQLAGRLTFFRAVFGQAGTRWGGLTRQQVLELAEGYLHGSRVHFDWQPSANDVTHDGTLPGDTVRLLLGLIMLATDALPRGGNVSLQIAERSQETELSLRVCARSVRLADDIMEALRGTQASAVTPRTVHAFYLSCVANRLEADIALQRGSDDVLEIRARLPQGRGMAEQLLA
jgi:histidine phosphotransferase ChpT